MLPSFGIPLLMKGSSFPLTDIAAFFKLDGDAQDASGNGNHGILATAPPITFETGFHGQAARGFLNNAINGPIPLGSSFTIAARCKTGPQAGGYYGGIITESSSEGLFVRGNGKFSFYAAGADHDTTASWTVNGWTHVLATYDGTDLKFYVDGIYDSTHTFAISSGTYTVANILNAGNGYPSDLVDDVALYTRVLAAAEALQVATLPFPY